MRIGDDNDSLGSVANLAMQIDILSKRAHEIAQSKGFWDIVEHPAVYIALMHTELSECIEAIRNADDPRKKDDWPRAEKINSNKYNHIEEELADTMIRILDFAGYYGLNLGGAILDKMEYNEGRTVKHGKSF